jgi:hypothetical protein
MAAVAKAEEEFDTPSHHNLRAALNMVRTQFVLN